MAAEQSAKALRLGAQVLGELPKHDWSTRDSKQFGTLVRQFFHVAYDTAKEVSLTGSGGDAAAAVTRLAQDVARALSNSSEAPKTLRKEVDEAMTSILSVQRHGSGGNESDGDNPHIRDEEGQPLVTGVTHDEDGSVGEEDDEDDEEDDEEYEEEVESINENSSDSSVDCSDQRLCRAALLTKLAWAVALLLIIGGGATGGIFVVMDQLATAERAETSRTLHRLVDIAAAGLRVYASQRPGEIRSMLPNYLSAFAEGPPSATLRPSARLVEFGAWLRPRRGPLVRIPANTTRLAALALVRKQVHLEVAHDSFDGTYIASVPSPGSIANPSPPSRVAHDAFSAEEVVLSSRGTDAMRYHATDEVTSVTIEALRDKESVSELSSRLIASEGPAVLGGHLRHGIGYAVVSIALTASAVWGIIEAFLLFVRRSGSVALALLIFATLLTGVGVGVAIFIFFAQYRETVMTDMRASNLELEALMFARAAVHLSAILGTPINEALSAMVHTLHAERHQGIASAAIVLVEGSVSSRVVPCGAWFSCLAASRAELAGVAVFGEPAGAVITSLARANVDAPAGPLVGISVGVMVIFSAVCAAFAMTGVSTHLTTFDVGAFVIGRLVRRCHVKTALHATISCLTFFFAAVSIGVSVTEWRAVRTALLIDSTAAATVIAASLSRTSQRNAVEMREGELRLQHLKSLAPSTVEFLLVDSALNLGAEDDIRTPPYPVLRGSLRPRQGAKAGTWPPDVSSAAGSFTANAAISGQQAIFAQAASHNTPEYDPGRNVWAPDAARSNSVISATTTISGAKHGHSFVTTGLLVERRPDSRMSDGTFELEAAILGITVSLGMLLLVYGGVDFFWRQAVEAGDAQARDDTEQVSARFRLQVVCFIAVLAALAPAIGGLIMANAITTDARAVASREAAWIADMVAVSALGNDDPAPSVVALLDTNVRRACPHGLRLRAHGRFANGTEWSLGHAEASAAGGIERKATHTTGSSESVTVFAAFEEGAITEISSGSYRFLRNLMTALLFLTVLLFALVVYGIVYSATAHQLLYFDASQIFPLETADGGATGHSPWMPRYIARFHIVALVLPAAVLAVFAVIMLLQIEGVKTSVLLDPKAHFDDLAAAVVAASERQSALPSGELPAVASTVLLHRRASRVLECAASVILTAASTPLRGVAVDALTAALRALGETGGWDSPEEATFVPSLLDSLSLPLAEPVGAGGSERISSAAVELPARVRELCATLDNVGVVLQTALTAEFLHAPASHEFSEVSQAAVRNISLAAHAAFLLSRAIAMQFSIIDGLAQSPNSTRDYRHVFESAVGGLIAANGAGLHTVFPTGVLEGLAADVDGVILQSGLQAETQQQQHAAAALMVELHRRRNDDLRVPTSSDRFIPPRRPFVSESAAQAEAIVSAAASTLKRRTHEAARVLTAAHRIHQRLVPSFWEQHAYVDDTRKVRNIAVGCAATLLVLALTVGLWTNLLTVRGALRIATRKAQRIPAASAALRRVSVGMLTNAVGDDERLHLLSRGSIDIFRTHIRFMLGMTTVFVIAFVPCFVGVVLSVDHAVGEASDSLALTSVFFKRLEGAAGVAIRSAELPSMAAMQIISIVSGNANIEVDDTVQLMRGLRATWEAVKGTFDEGTGGLLAFAHPDQHAIHADALAQASVALREVEAALTVEIRTAVSISPNNRSTQNDRRPHGERHPIEAASAAATVLLSDVATPPSLTYLRSGGALQLHIYSLAEPHHASPHRQRNFTAAHIMAAGVAHAEASIACASQHLLSPTGAAEALSLLDDAATQLQSTLNVTQNWLPGDVVSAVHGQYSALLTGTLRANVAAAAAGTERDLLPPWPSTQLESVLWESALTHAYMSSDVSEQDFSITFAQSRGLVAGGQYRDGIHSLRAALEAFQEHLVNTTIYPTVSSAGWTSLIGAQPQAERAHRGAEWSAIVGMWTIAVAMLALMRYSRLML